MSDTTTQKKREQSVHRKNGYAHIKKTLARKKRYGKTTDIATGLASVRKNQSPRFSNVKDAGTISHAKRYVFDYEDNFTHWKSPYDNQAHHLIPQQFDDLFSDEEKKILRQIGYNINVGQNIIYLPEDELDCPIHDLPYHCGSHGDYNDQVMEEADGLREKLQKDVKDACEKKKDLPKDLMKKFDEISQRLWNTVSEAGQGKVNEIYATDEDGDNATDEDGDK